MSARHTGYELGAYLRAGNTLDLGSTYAPPITQTYSTATATHANPTAAALTVADGAGTNDGTIGAITGDASVIAAVQELAAQINKLVTDLANVKQVLNAVIDAQQQQGFLK